MKVGIDIGSTTIKLVVMDEERLIFKNYARHFSEIGSALTNSLTSLKNIIGEKTFKIAVAGSAGMGIAKKISLPFVQEVIACQTAVEKFIPQTDTVVELGGENAKIIYLGNAPEVRMNGVCAGGTGSFIDHMASLLSTDALGLNALAEKGKQIYTIASRCGVFAKTDIQALMNDGAKKADIALSIFQAVVNQTIGNLAQGRPIKGNVAFLGGPLHFLPELKKRFVETLGLSKDEVVETPDENFFVATGAALSDEADSAVKGTVELKYKIVDGKNDVLGPLYYVVSLDEKIKHFLMPGWFEDMDAPVRAVVLLQPHDRGLITPMESLERSMVIDNWEYTKKYLLETGGQISGGKWNHYKAKDGVGVEYANNNPYRTESVVVKPTSRNDDKSSKKSDGQSTDANGNTWYSELEVDSINIDFRADVGVNSMFTTDWDLGSGVASKLSNFSAYTNVSNSYPWKEGNGEDKRVLFNVDFEDSFKTRDPSKRADVLWARIESDPIIRQLQYDGNPVKNYNSVRQVTVNFSSDNTALTSDGKSYAYRPYVLFYTGPENIDYAKDSNGVLIRHSQPVVINFNEDTNAIIYMPESPVVINGNGNKLTGFIIAKCYLSSVTQEEMTSGSTIKLYDGFNTPENFKCDFEKGKDSSEQTVFFHEDDLLDISYIRGEHTGTDIDVFEIDSGDIHITEKIESPECILIEYTKADSENEAYEVIENGKHNENKTFGKYVNATYKEKFKAFSGLTDSQIVAVTFPDENHNETTATYYVENSSEIISDKKENSNYVKVLIDGNVKYLDKTKLPYVKVRTDKDYFYVNVYDLKLTTSGGKGLRMIDNSYTDEQLNSSYKKTGNITTTDGDVHVNLNDAIYNQYGDSWAIDRTWYSNQRGNWKKDKLEWGKKNGVTYFTSKVETATLPKELQIIAKYHKITMLDEDGEVLLDDDGKPVVKYVKDDDDDKIEYYTKVQNNDKNSDNYIIVDKKGNMLTKPLTSPDVLDVDTVAENTFVHAQAAAGSSILSDYWNTYTRAPKDPYEIPLDYKPNNDALADGNYRGNANSHKEKDYRIPALERVYKAEKSFNLSEDSCYSYFGIEELWRINYVYLDVDEINQKVYNDETERYNWKVDDMFYTTKRAEWID